MLMQWTAECGEYSNHHEMFHIALAGLTEKRVQKALEDIMGPNGWAMDGMLFEDGAMFSTAKEDIELLAMRLSQYFPEATVFGQDCWDHEGHIVCFKNGKKSKNYNAAFTVFEQSEEYPNYYVIELLVKAENGYEFEAGGGLVHKENIPAMKDFIAGGKETT